MFLGAGAGGVTRWAGAHGVNALLALHPRWQPHWFPPLAILVVNVVGSLLVGYFAGKFGANHAMRMFFVVGFCGGFTTFSSFALDSHDLWLHAERPVAALFNILLRFVFALCRLYRSSPRWQPRSRATKRAAIAAKTSTTKARQTKAHLRQPDNFGIAKRGKPSARRSAFRPIKNTPLISMNGVCF